MTPAGCEGLPLHAPRALHLSLRCLKEPASQTLYRLPARLPEVPDASKQLDPS